jgi:ectoine hydroxylase-related dioxygenase (phytanoyl-CoA dioxygenase family)
MTANFDGDGVETIPCVLTADECAGLIDAVAALPPSRSRRPAGARNLLRDCPAVAALASREQIARLAANRLHRGVFPVRALFFDKTETANWSMPWHQDTVIAVAEKIETPGFGPWSSKAGVVHVQPPREILEDMAAIRLHLDDCDAGNGALKISPGSHLHGILSDAEIDRWKQNGVTVCEVPKGGALLMRPLVLHASSAATQPRHRRVIHIEYASGNLPNGLRWFERK